MFQGTAPVFEDIMNRLGRLEAEINRLKTAMRPSDP